MSPSPHYSPRDHIGDSFELGCELPRFVRRKHRVRRSDDAT